MCPRQASRNYPTYPISDVCRGSDIDEVPPKPEQGQAVGEPPSGAEGKAAGLHLQGCPRGREDSCKGLEVFAEALLDFRICSLSRRVAVFRPSLSASIRQDLQSAPARLYTWPTSPYVWDLPNQRRPKGMEPQFRASSHVTVARMPS